MLCGARKRCGCFLFFFSSRRRHTRWTGDWSSDVCSSDLLPEQNSQAVYQRMQTERQQEAAQYRAEGAQKAQEIRAKADRDVTVLIAEAQSKGERTRGEGDGERNRIFADAYGRDPDFFSFYRSMQAYEAGLRANDTRMLLKPDSEFCRYFVDPSGKPREGRAQPGNTPSAK